VAQVANGGRPIPPDQVAGPFEPFRRLGGDRTGSDRGAGRGLPIVRSVAAAHGGTASARAIPGRRLGGHRGRAGVAGLIPDRYPWTRCR
jgi:signal transduction histidine kinase